MHRRFRMHLEYENLEATFGFKNKNQIFHLKLLVDQRSNKIIQCNDIKIVFVNSTKYFQILNIQKRCPAKEQQHNH